MAYKLTGTYVGICTLGKSSGTAGVFGQTFEANYGEAAEFEWAG